jgi:hypothetical protein
LSSSSYKAVGDTNLTSEDIVFAVLEESLRRLEPIISSFEKEAQILVNLSLNLSYIEKMDFVRRTHMAKEMMMFFS